MMKSRRWLIILVFTLISSTIFPPNSTRAQTTYRLMFGSLDEMGAVYLGLLDPVAPQATVKLEQIVASGASPRTIRIVPSPDGHYLALLSRYVYTTGLDNVDVKDLQTGEIHSVISEVATTGEFGMPGFYGETQDIVWSPDSRYLAIAAIKDVPHIFVYAVASQTSFQLTDSDGTYHLRVAWSSDSRKVVTTSEVCSEPTICRAELQIYDVIEQRKTTSVDIAKYTFGSGGLGQVACDLDWSPDDRYISLMMVCSFMTNRSREIYLWDTQQNLLLEITNFTEPFANRRELQAFETLYNIIWYDDDTLLISVIYSSTPDKWTTISIIYDASTRHTNTLTTSYIDDWAINPVTGQLALHRLSTVTSLLGPTTDRSTLMIGTISKGSFIAASQIESTSIRRCQLLWSPDGRWLAYIGRQESCLGFRVTMGFIDERGRIFQRAITKVDQPAFNSFNFVGWVLRQ